LLTAAVASLSGPSAHAGPARSPHPARFVPGEATAIAEAAQVAPRTGGLSAAITVGTSIADYRESLAQASSQTLDLGVIGSTLTVQCDASPPAARPDQLPQPLVAESDRGNSHASKSTVGSGKGLAAAAGREFVRATTQPGSTATFDGNAIAVPGALTMSGLHSESHARLVPHTARIATAQATVGTIKLLGGKVVLSGLRWNAVKRTGNAPTAKAQFTMQSAIVAGKHLPVSGANLKTTAATLNRALGATGIHLTLPRRVLHNGKIEETPLTIGIDDSQVGNNVINPLLGAVQPVTNAVLTALIGINCKLGSLLSAVDLIVSGVDGTGGLDLNLGGASATSDGKTYADPFAHTPQSHNSQHHAAGGHRHSTSKGGTTTTSTGSSGSGGANNTATTSGGGDGQTQPLTDTSSSSSSCATTSPAGWPSCSRGAGLKVGLIALGLLAAFALSDAVVLRLRREPETPT
jgi:hypothetical protein